MTTRKILAHSMILNPGNRLTEEKREEICKELNQILKSRLDSIVSKENIFRFYSVDTQMVSYACLDEKINALHIFLNLSRWNLTRINNLY